MVPRTMPGGWSGPVFMTTACSALASPCRTPLKVPECRPGPLCGGKALPLSPSLCPQTLQNEILGHAPRVEDVLQRGQQLVEAVEVDCQDIEERLGRLQDLWDTLREAATGRLQRLRDASEAQQYYLDAGEAEAWISEQELYIISDELPKVSLGWGGARLGSRGSHSWYVQVCEDAHYSVHTAARCPVCQLRLDLTQDFLTFLVPWVLY